MLALMGAAPAGSLVGQASLNPTVAPRAAELARNGQRGIGTEDAVGMIVNGFCKEVMRKLPMEFAVEAQKLLGVSLEGSVG